MTETTSIIKEHNSIDNPKFSLILPVYNVGKYLVKCLDSIINQTLDDIEVICINDGSTDNSLEILNKYAELDKRFIIVSQENQGQGVARNNALKIAKGQYIVFIDPDDWIECNLLEELYKTFKITDSEVIQFDYNEYNDFSGKFKNINFAKCIKRKFDYDLKYVPFYSWKNVKSGCLCELDMHVWARAYSREFLNRVQAVFSPTKHGEDHLFANIVTLNADKIFYLDKYLYNYRCRNGSAVNKRSNDNFCIFQNIDLLKEYLVTHSFYEELRDEFNNYKSTVMAWHYKNIPEENREKYKTKCQEYLTPEEYKKMQRQAKGYNSFLETIFSLKNERNFGIKYKVITILGIKIKIKPKQKVKGGATL